MYRFLIVIAVVIVIVLIVILLRKLFQNRGGGAPVPAEPPYRVDCGSERELPRAPGGRQYVTVDVIEHCGGGVVLEQQHETSGWIGLVPRRLTATTEVDPVLHGRGVHVGVLPNPLRIACRPGSADGCLVDVKYQAEPAGNQPGRLVTESRNKPVRCGEVAYVGVFSDIRSRAYEATITVESDCGEGVEIHRQGMRGNDVSIGGATSDPGPVFDLGRGQTVTFRVQPRAGEPGCWFRVTCKGSSTDTSCSVSVRITEA